MIGSGLRRTHSAVITAPPRPKARRRAIDPCGTRGPLARSATAASEDSRRSRIRAKRAERRARACRVSAEGRGSESKAGLPLLGAAGTDVVRPAGSAAEADVSPASPGTTIRPSTDVRVGVAFVAWRAVVGSGRLPELTTISPALDSPSASFADSPGTSAVASELDGSDPPGGGDGWGAAGVGLGCSAAGGGAEAGVGLEAGGAMGAGGGMGALRGGSNSIGSTYVSLSPTRIPRWRYGTSCSDSPVGPGSAIGSPSATLAPFRTRNAPTWVSDTLWPSPVTIVTVSPCTGTEPAKETNPDAGARTSRDSPSATSIPRCWPAA
jgi:hypothetical protein